jgi:hypothetical protein
MLGECQVAAPLMAQRAAHGAFRLAHRRFQPGEGVGIQLAGLRLSGKPQRPSQCQFGHETLVLALALLAPAASRPGQHCAVRRQRGRQVAPCGHASTVGQRFLRLVRGRRSRSSCAYRCRPRHFACCGGDWPAEDLDNTSHLNLCTLLRNAPRRRQTTWVDHRCCPSDIDGPPMTFPGRYRPGPGAAGAGVDPVQGQPNKASGTPQAGGAPGRAARSTGSRSFRPLSLLARVSRASIRRACSPLEASTSRAVERQAAEVVQGSSSATWRRVRSAVRGVRSW